MSAVAKTAAVASAAPRDARTQTDDRTAPPDGHAAALGASRSTIGRAAKYSLTVIQNRTGRVPARPSWCTFLVTYRCNARCKMCDSWRLKPGSELTSTQIDEVFGKIGPLDVVRLTGGEPFLREDMTQIARAVIARSAPLVLHVTTNGSFPDRVARFVDELGPHEARTRLAFLVSFDGMPEEHDASRGEDVTFDRALDTVRLLAHRGVRVAVNHTVISKRSLEDNDALRRTLQPLGVDVHSVLAYSDSAMYSIKLRGKRAEHLIARSGYPLHPSLEGADVIGFVERELARVDELRARERVGKRYYLRGLLARLRADPEPRPRPRCVALRSHLRLLPDGRVPVCQFNTETVGNLSSTSFVATWRSHAADRARAWVDACPGCWAECEVVPSAVYTGDVVRGAV
ncbi:MAG TPA: radical SAM protein [Polyangiaceae bacterium]|nr:radical SAM protein [Polyangiaceae bacterium]